MQKVVVRMRGGLGNQLFILSCAYYVKNYCIPDSEIVLDVREFDTYKVRNFEILQLINDRNIRLYDKQIDNSIAYEVSRKIYHIAQKFIDSHKKINPILVRNGFIYSKRSAEGIEACKLKSDLYLYGYFQDARMASKIKPLLLDIIKDFNTKYKLSHDVKYIAISIRWGKDYVEQGWPICSREYFEKGIREIIEEKYQNDKVCAIVFSDEIQKAKKLNLPCKSVFIEGLSASQQLSLMRKCSDYVISNSSFSWWGAFLGCNEDSIVIAPDIWYDTKELTSRTLLNYKNMRIRDMGWKQK